MNGVKLGLSIIKFSVYQAPPLHYLYKTDAEYYTVF